MRLTITILTGDFAEPEKGNIPHFLYIYNLENLLKQKTCYKNSDSASCRDLDLIVTNCHESFLNTNLFKTGLSDLHEMTLSVLKLHFPKRKSNIVSYRSYKWFRNNSFRCERDNRLFNYNLYSIEDHRSLNILFKDFE